MKCYVVEIIDEDGELTKNSLHELLDKHLPNGVDFHVQRDKRMEQDHGDRDWCDK